MQRLLNSLLDRFWRFWASNDRWRMVQDPAKKKLRFSKCFIAKNAIFVLLCLSFAPDIFNDILLILWCPWVLTGSCLQYDTLGVVLFTNIKESTIAEQFVDITYDCLSPSKNKLGSILNQSGISKFPSPRYPRPIPPPRNRGYIYYMRLSIGLRL